MRNLNDDHDCDLNDECMYGYDENGIRPITSSDHCYKCKHNREYKDNFVKGEKEKIVIDKDAVWMA